MDMALSAFSSNDCPLCERCDTRCELKDSQTDWQTKADPISSAHEDSSSSTNMSTTYNSKRQRTAENRLRQVKSLNTSIDQFVFSAALDLASMMSQSICFDSGTQDSSSEVFSNVTEYAFGYKCRIANDMVLLREDLCYSRYLKPRETLPRNTNWIAEVLPSMSDKKFLFHCRLDRRCFSFISYVLDEKCYHFFVGKRGPLPTSIPVQLYIAMQSFGFYGNSAGAEMIADRLGISEGLVVKCRENVSEALCSLAAEVIRWPNEAERKAFCEYARKHFGFPNCFFSVDGTTHPLAEVPGFNKEAFYDRKSRYSLHALVTSDHRKKVINLVLGWPGSVHDAKVLSVTDYMKADDAGTGNLYFTEDQHGLGDAAFGPSTRVVPTYKSPQTQYAENVAYNTIHGSLRVKGEHVNGMVKCRLQGMREVRIRISCRDDMVRVTKFLLAGYVIHNICLDLTDTFWESFQSETSIRRASEAYDTGSQDQENEVSSSQRDGGALFREHVKEKVLLANGYAF